MKFCGIPLPRVAGEVGKTAEHVRLVLTGQRTDNDNITEVAKKLIIEKKPAIDEMIREYNQLVQEMM